MIPQPLFFPPWTEVTWRLCPQILAKILLFCFEVVLLQIQIAYFQTFYAVEKMFQV